MSDPLALPIRPHSEVPTRSMPSFPVRRRVAAELPGDMVGETLPEVYRTTLLQFVADWNRSPGRTMMIQPAPSYGGPDPYLLPSIASVAQAPADPARPHSRIQVASGVARVVPSGHRRYRSG